MIVLPLFAKALRIRMRIVAVYESSPVVGSSRKIKLGFVISSTPIEHLFLSPPETPFITAPPIFVFSHLVNLRSSKISLTRYTFESSDPCSLSFAANIRHSLTEKVWKSTSSC